MTGLLLVAGRTIALSLCGLMLTACAAPMGQREAVTRANRSLSSLCVKAACGPTKLIRAQRLKDHWLLDYETSARFYGVMVDIGGNTQVSVWDKNPSPAR